MQLTPAGIRTASAGVTLPIAAGTVSAASFTVQGQANYTYAITLPSSVSIYDAGNANNMTVSTFMSVPSVAGVLSASGSQRLDVGATLHVGAGQAAGNYTSGTPFSVTVNYN